MFAKCAISLMRTSGIGKNNKTGNILIKHLSTQDIIAREDKYTAHNYHPLPVVLTKGQGENFF